MFVVADVTDRGVLFGQRSPASGGFRVAADRPATGEPVLRLRRVARRLPAADRTETRRGPGGSGSGNRHALFVRNVAETAGPGQGVLSQVSAQRGVRRRGLLEGTVPLQAEGVRSESAEEEGPSGRSVATPRPHSARVAEGRLEVRNSQSDCRLRMLSIMMLPPTK